MAEHPTKWAVSEPVTSTASLDSIRDACAGEA
jgi:hypothetical protein